MLLRTGNAANLTVHPGSSGGNHPGVPGMVHPEWSPFSLGGNVLWLRPQTGLTFGGTPRASGLTPPVVTLTGTLAFANVAPRVEIQTTGARGTATFRYSGDNGATWIESSKTTAATYNAIGALSGMVFNFPVGTYTNDNVYLGTVATWGDRSGGAKDATQATAANQPSIDWSTFNGQPSMFFTSANSTYLACSSALVSSGDWTMYVAYRKTTTAASYLLGCTAAANGLFVFPSAAGELGFFDGTSSLTTAGGMTTNANYWCEVVKSGTTYTITTSNGLTTSGTLTAIFPTAFQIGRRGNGSVFHQGYIGDIFVFNRALIASERVHPRAALRAKWGTQ